MKEPFLAFTIPKRLFEIIIFPTFHNTWKCLYAMCILTGNYLISNFWLLPPLLYEWTYVTSQHMVSIIRQSESQHVFIVVYDHKLNYVSWIFQTLRLDSRKITHIGYEISSKHITSAHTYSYNLSEHSWLTTANFQRFLQDYIFAISRV